jgi:hypothetical protein
VEGHCHSHLQKMECQVPTILFSLRISTLQFYNKLGFITFYKKRGLTLRISYINKLTEDPQIQCHHGCGKTGTLLHCSWLWLNWREWFWKWIWLYWERTRTVSSSWPSDVTPEVIWRTRLLLACSHYSAMFMREH